MSWKPVFEVQGEWCDNAQRFATEREAKDSAAARYMVWSTPTGYDAVESDEPVNYARVNDRDQMVNREVAA